MQDYKDVARLIPSMCVGHRTRMAARALSRHYQSYFRGTSLTASRFAILVSLAAKPEQSVAQLGSDLGMESTTMVRAVQQLERRGLVVARGGRGRQSKRSSLTTDGWRALQRGIARWQAAHRAVVEALGGKGPAQSILAAVNQLDRAAGSLLERPIPNRTKVRLRRRRRSYGVARRRLTR